MTARPDTFPDFATTERIDPILNAPNIQTPPAELVNFGWQYTMPAFMSYMNWFQHWVALWIHYFDERINKADSYSVTTAPSASTTGAGASIYVTNDIGGSTLAVSDGTNWRRTSDRAIISLI